MKFAQHKERFSAIHSLVDFTDIDSVVLHGFPISMKIFKWILSGLGTLPDLDFLVVRVMCDYLNFRPFIECSFIIGINSLTLLYSRTKFD